MNKHLPNSLRALFLSLAVLLSLPMLAAQVEIDGIRYDLNAEAKQAAVIAKSSGKYSGEVVIPESVEFKGVTHSVTSIGDGAFGECYGLTSVTIGNSVTSIGANAFEGCSGLTSVTIGNSVEIIGFLAFSGCFGLNSVTIGNSVEIIGFGAFRDCSDLTSVTIPNSVTSIGESAFSGCSCLTSVTIGNSVTSIGVAAFYGCSGLTSLTIPNSVTSIGLLAFSDCSGLTSVTIGNSVEIIGEKAFRDCPELLDVYCYAEKVPSTQSNAFDGSNPENATLHVPDASIDSYKSTAPWSSFDKIVAISTEVDGINYDFDADAKQATVIAKSSGKYSGEVVIPESVEFKGVTHSVTSIGANAFEDCSGLTSVTIGNSVEIIGFLAFSGCFGLNSVTIGNSVEIIGFGAFRDCSDLTSVTIPNSVTSIGESAFSGCSCLTSVTIGNSVTSIGVAAFYGCSGLTSLTIPNSVTSIGLLAFSGCSCLTSVTIPNSVTSIGEKAFYNCDGLTSVTIPNSVTSIGDRAFDHCSGLTSVTIGSSVKSIGEEAFANCSELLDVYCYAEKVPSTKSNAFDGSYPEYITLHVPDASVESYKATAPWSGFGKIVGLSGEEPEQPEVPEVEKCATPVVTYAEGKLSFSCETEGAEFVTDITDSDIKKYYDAEIELSATYNIEVFATKANYENSDTVSVALVWVENGNVDEETGIISVEAAPVLIQGNGGILTVSGVAKGTDVVVYTISGTEVARAIATDGTATISTGLQSGTIVVVKFGNKSVKVRI